MSDDVKESEFDAVAAEYVLGTLDASERAHTHVLLGIDDAFALRVKQWERRLGELHLMVEPIEPDWRVYERVKQRIGGFQANPFYAALGARMGEDGLPVERGPESAAVGTPAELPAPQAMPPEAPATLDSTVPPPLAALTPLAQTETAGLWDVAPAETAPPESVGETAPVLDAPSLVAPSLVAPSLVAPSLVAPSLDTAASAESATQPAPMATEQPLSDPVTALVHETPTAPMDDAVAESPPLQAAEPMREPTLVQPASPTAAALAQVAESERTIPYSDVHAAPTIVPSAQIARDVEHWHRATRQWRALAMAMTVLALCLGGFVATLRNFPERLPPSVRAQFSALAAMPGDIFRIRRAAPPESQFDE